MSNIVESNRVKANELIAMAAMPGDLIKKEMDSNYLSLLVQQYPDLDQKYFIDFISKAMLTGADPRLNEIYLVVHNTHNKDKNVKEPKGTVIHDYKFLMKKAEATGELDDHNVEVIEEQYLDIASGRKRLSFTAIATIVRKGKKTTFKARFWEFAKIGYEGALSGNWRTMPMFMLEKTAMANALRWAFPDQLGSIYIREEMEKVIDPVEYTSKNKVEQPEKNQTKQIEAKKEVVQTIEVPNQDVNTNEIQHQEKEPEIEEKRKELIDFITHSHSSFFEKIGIDRGTLLAKVMNETDEKEMTKKYQWCLRKLEELEKEQNGTA